MPHLGQSIQHRCFHEKSYRLFPITSKNLKLLPRKYHPSHTTPPTAQTSTSVIPATNSDKLTPLPGRGTEHSPVPTFLAN